MKKHTLSLLIAVMALPAWAQNAATDVQAEHARIAAERRAVEERYSKEREGCYQKFAVEDCMSDSRRRRREQTEDLKRQEAVLNDAERKRRGAAELERLDQKVPTPESAANAEARRDKSVESQKDREQRAAASAASREAAASQSAKNKKEFADKQRRHAEDQAKAEQERAREAQERADYEAKQKKAEKDRADLDARNAKRTKPRAAPLPPGPP